MKLLENKNAVITGGSDGIGLAIAHSFAQNGANILLIGRDLERLEKACKQLSIYKIKVQYLSADLSEIENIKNISEEVLKLSPDIDILVNNAGVGRFVPFEKTDLALLDLHLNLNIKAPYLLTQQLLVSLIKTKGSIINISSVFANHMLSKQTTTAYALTKGALDSFTRSLAFEIGQLGIRVNAIAPGSISTPQMERNLDRMTKDEREAFQEQVKHIYPLPKKIGTSEDIGKAALFLASDQSDWIIGTIMNVDGGFSTN